MNDTKTIPHAVTWFEIPSEDFEQAVTFYETVLGVALERATMDGETFGMFPHDAKNGVGGCVLDSERIEPGPGGPNIFLYAPDGLDGPLGRVERAGGSVLQPKTRLCEEIGYVAEIRDTEGNRIGLHCLHA